MKENFLTYSLNEGTYIMNPNFTNSKNIFKLSFQSCKVDVLKNAENKELFVKSYLDQRQRLYLKIPDKIFFWGK